MARAGMGLGSTAWRGLIGLALVLGSSSCLRLNWSRQMIHTEVSDGVLAQLGPGDGLQRCLALLGAPLLVLELGGGESALVYGWLKEAGFGFNVSAPVSDNYSASFDYDQIDRRVQGILLLLDGEQRLILVRRGLLRDLLAEHARKRPAFDRTWVGESGE